MLLMAQGLKHRKTCVLDGSSMALGGEGAAPLWRLGKTHIWHAKVMFCFGFTYFVFLQHDMQ